MENKNYWVVRLERAYGIEGRELLRIEFRALRRGKMEIHVTYRLHGPWKNTKELKGLVDWARKRSQALEIPFFEQVLQEK